MSSPCRNVAAIYHCAPYPAVKQKRRPQHGHSIGMNDDMLDSAGKLKQDTVKTSTYFNTHTYCDRELSPSTSLTAASGVVIACNCVIDLATQQEKQPVSHKGFFCYGIPNGHSWMILARRLLYSFLHGRRKPSSRLGRVLRLLALLSSSRPGKLPSLQLLSG